MKVIVIILIVIALCGCNGIDLHCVMGRVVEKSFDPGGLTPITQIQPGYDGHISIETTLHYEPPDYDLLVDVDGDQYWLDVTQHYYDVAEPGDMIEILAGERYARMPQNGECHED